MLKSVMLANAVSCTIFGLIFIFQAAATSGFVGDPPVLLLQILGVGLVINAVLLTITAFRNDPRPLDIALFALGDGIWVLATIIMVVLGIWITTTAGISASIAVAAFVGFCGFMQWRLRAT